MRIREGLGGEGGKPSLAFGGVVGVLVWLNSLESGKCPTVY